MALEMSVMAFEMSVIARENQIKQHGKDVLYMLNNFYFNSGDARYLHSVNIGQYLASSPPGWGRR